MVGLPELAHVHHRRPNPPAKATHVHDRRPTPPAKAAHVCRNTVDDTGDRG
jgi:hypothetical protein